MRWHTAIAVVLAAIALVANAANLLFLDFFGPFVVLPWALGTFAGVGLVVALRRPGHPVGWLFLVTGTSFALTFYVQAYSWQALVVAQGTLPAGEVAAWLSFLLWRPGVGSLLIAVMLFPSGRPLWRRWGVTIAAMSAVFALLSLSPALAPAPIGLPLPFTDGSGQGDVATIPNPFGIGGPPGDVLRALRPITDGTVLAFILLALMAVVLRFARSSGTERLQLKWFAYAASVSLVVVILAFLLPSGVAGDIARTASGLSLALIPVGAGIAILRYRLYDIDLLIKRTVVYGATTTAIAAVFFFGIVGLQTLLRPLTAGSELAIAAATLVSFALFQPVRRRLQRLVDQRFDRSRYDAARTLDAFADQLRDEVDLDTLRDDLLGAVRQTMAPAHASVWLRERPR